MDYRELENRMERNRDMIKDRAYERLIKEAKKAQKANRPPRTSWFASLRALVSSLKGPKVEPQPRLELKPRPQFKQQH